MKFISVFRKAVADWHNDNSQFVAGGLSFFAIFSIVPLGIITFSFLGLFFSGVSAKGIVLSKVSDMFSPAASESLALVLAHTQANGIRASFISVIVLLWAGSRVFMQLQRALSHALHIAPADLTRIEKLGRFVQNRMRALVATLGLGFSTVLFLGLDVVVGTFGDLLHHFIPPVWLYLLLPLISSVLSLVLFTILFALIYRFLPHAHPGWRAIWSGASVASVLFAMLRWVLTHYLGELTPSLFGAAGAVMVILIWVYASMQILLFGAKFAWIMGSRRLERD